MSRSYKKNPFITDNGPGRSYAKRYASHKFRREIAKDEDMPSHPQYKKYVEGWDICDYKWRMTRAEAIEWYETKAGEWFKKNYPTLEKWLQYWAKCHVRK